MAGLKFKQEKLQTKQSLLHHKIQPTSENQGLFSENSETNTTKKNNGIYVIIILRIKYQKKQKYQIMIPDSQLNTNTVKQEKETGGNIPKQQKKLPLKLNIQTRKFIPPTAGQPNNNNLKQPLSPAIITDSTLSSSESSRVGEPKHPITPTEQIHFESSDKFYEKYELKQILGHGSSGMVNKCVKKDNSYIYVVKRTKCQPEQIQIMKHSYNIIKTLSHPNIIKYKSLYISTSQHKSYLVMEYYEYPTLTETYDQIQLFKEEDLQSIVYQLLDAIAYMHSIGLCHRDIKPDNILYDAKGKNIKIIDFGVSRDVGTGVGKKMMLTCTGTTEYKAPELFYSGYYDQLIDEWAAGITIYKLITGKTPFSSSEYIKQTIQNIENCNLAFEEPVWEKYSNFVKDLIRSLVCHRQERITAEEAKNSLWFKSGHQEFCQSVKPRKHKKQHMFMNSVNIMNMNNFGKGTNEDGENEKNSLRRSFPFMSDRINQEESDCDFSDEEIEDEKKRNSKGSSNKTELLENKQE